MFVIIIYSPVNIKSLQMPVKGYFHFNVTEWMNNTVCYLPEGCTGWAAAVIINGILHERDSLGKTEIIHYKSKIFSPPDSRIKPQFFPANNVRKKQLVPQTPK